MENCDLRTCTDGNVSKLEGDVSASDKHDPKRQFFQLQEAITFRYVLLPRNIQLLWFRPGCNHDMAAFQYVTADSYRSGANKACPAMEDLYACLSKTLLLMSRHGIRERSLEAHKFRPFNAKILSVDPPPYHPPDPIDEFAGASQNFLRIASAQRACSPKRSEINNSYSPTGGATLKSNGFCRRAGTDYDDIEFLFHSLNLSFGVDCDCVRA